MIMKKRLALLLAAVLIMSSIAGCGTQSASSGAKTVDIELLGSSGTTYQVAVGVADIITNQLDSYRMSATGTTNTAANMIAMKDKDANKAIYMGSYAAFVQCQEGTVAFADYGPDDRGRLICAFSFGNNGLIMVQHSNGIRRNSYGGATKQRRQYLQLGPLRFCYWNRGLDTRCRSAVYRCGWILFSSGLQLGK